MNEEFTPLDLTFTTDQSCHKLADYLASNLNRLYYELTGDNRLTLVKTIRSWNDFTVPVADFPVLKVYRLSDLYNPQSKLSISSMALQYHVTIPEQKKLVPLFRYISYNIDKLLISSIHTTGIFVLEGGKSAEYRVFPTESFLKFNFRIKD